MQIDCPCIRECSSCFAASVHFVVLVTARPPRAVRFHVLGSVYFGLTPRISVVTSPFTWSVRSCLNMSYALFVRLSSASNSGSQVRFATFAVLSEGASLWCDVLPNDGFPGASDQYSSEMTCLSRAGVPACLPLPGKRGGIGTEGRGGDGGRGREGGARVFASPYWRVDIRWYKYT